MRPWSNGISRDFVFLIAKCCRGIQGSLKYKPQQSIIIGPRQITQNDNTFVLFDSANSGHLTTPGESDQHLSTTDNTGGMAYDHTKTHTQELSAHPKQKH